MLPQALIYSCVSTAIVFYAVVYRFYMVLICIEKIL